MKDYAKSALNLLTPPGEDQDATTWRWAVFVSIIVLACVIGVHLAAANGMLARFGISGIAYASDVDSINQRSVSILYAIYSPQVRAKVRQRCDTNDAAARERINTELSRILREYEHAAGQPFGVMPRCDEV